MGVIAKHLFRVSYAAKSPGNMVSLGNKFLPVFPNLRGLPMMCAPKGVQSGRDIPVKMK